MYKSIITLCLLCLFGLVCADQALAAGRKADPKRIVFIMTSHYELFGTGKKTGVWFDTLATPYYAFKDAGYQITLASIKGGRPSLDPRSEQDKTKAVERFLKDQAAMEQFSSTVVFTDIKAQDYDAVFIAGGHGVAWDCIDNNVLKKLLWDFVSANKIIAAVDHGSAVMLLLSDGTTSLLKGRKVAVFTLEEEKALKLNTVVPGSADMALEKAGVKVVRAKPFTANAVRDGNIITGQNPASTAKVTKLTLKALKEKR